MIVNHLLTPQAEIDIGRIRLDTPGCARVTHLNNAGASLPPRPVLETVIDHLKLEAAIGGYEAADSAAAALDQVYDSLARLINCHRDELAVVENATRAWDMAFYALPLREGDRILTAQAEYASNVIAFLQAARQRGVVIDVIPDDAHGQVSLAALEHRLDQRVKLIAITHVPTQGGLVNPAAAIGKIARRNAIPYLLDSCQAVGQMPIDVEAIGCDMLSATGRKFLRGPRGTGFLYVRRSLLDSLEPPFLDLHAARWTAADRYQMRPDARRFENWEGFVAGKLGLGAAADYALAIGLDRIERRARGLADGLRARLAEMPGITLRDLGQERCAIVSFTKDGEPARRVRARLRERSINVSVSTIASARYDFESRGLDEVVRVSPHYYNSQEEIDHFCGELRQDG